MPAHCCGHCGGPELSRSHEQHAPKQGAEVSGAPPRAKAASCASTRWAARGSAGANPGLPPVLCGRQTWPPPARVTHLQRCVHGKHQHPAAGSSPQIACSRQGAAGARGSGRTTCRSGWRAAAVQQAVRACSHSCAATKVARQPQAALKCRRGTLFQRGCSSGAYDGPACGSACCRWPNAARCLPHA